MGITPDEYKVDPPDMESGRYLNELDIKDFRKVALIGIRVYEELFKRGEDAVDKYIKINGSYYQVIGVFRSKHSGGWGEDQNSIIYIPFSTTQKIFNYANQVDHFSIVGKPNANIVEIEHQVLKLLAQRHTIHPDDKGAFGYNNVGVEFKK
ncbi:MAG: ABC transporter permease [Bacteroidales bacterium]|nr:ABC transporter permease [Bacteroidales bacterium]